MQSGSLRADQLLEFAGRLADEAAKAIAPYFRTQLEIEDKGRDTFDPVTIADRAAERAMRHLINTEYPSHGVLGEEDGQSGGGSRITWVLDPIDGTRAFMTGLPLWGTLVGLNDGQRPILGLMNQPFTGERYVGSASGAWRNGVALKTRTCGNLSSAVLMSTTRTYSATRSSAPPLIV